MANLAANLVNALGDLRALEVLYATDVVMSLPTSLVAEPIKGRDSVMAMHTRIWSEVFYPEVEAEILDNLSVGTLSAARFRFHARFRTSGKPYKNEYSVFVHARGDKIAKVYEGADTYYFIQECPEDRRPR